MLLVLAGLLLAPATAPPIAAHPADMYLQVLTVRLGPDGLALDWTITPGALLAFLAWDEADTDADAFVSPAEAIEWARPRLPDMAAVLDETTALGWMVDAITWPESLAEFERGDTPIHITMHADWPPDLQDRHDLILYNRWEEATSVNWFYVHGEDGVTFAAPGQTNGLLRLEVALDSPASEDFRTYWDSGTPALAAGEAAGGAAVSQPQGQTPAALLTDLVSTEDLSPVFYLAALGVALALGAIHALTPGHGKALVAAYLVGTRGTMRHAAALGLIVTLTHTGSVLAVGVITLFASRFFLPTALFPLLEMVSGLLIVAMGLGLLYWRWRGWRSVQRARARRKTPRPAPAPVSTTGTTAPRTITVNQPITSRDYDAVLPTGQFSLSGINWRSLLALGVSGGLVPCPDAIAILLVAVAINRLVLGLSLVVFFSLGLAAILIAIGIVMVRSRSFFSRLEWFNRAAPALPVFSAAVVLALGLVLTVNAASGAGLLGTGGESATVAALESLGVADNPLLHPFSLDEARLLYLASPERGEWQLFAVAAAGGEGLPLTNEPNGIWDYALSPDGTTVAYSTGDGDGGSAIWAVPPDGGARRMLLDCPDAICQGVVWSPDGARLVYERGDLSGAAALAGNGRSLWWLDVLTGETGSVFQDGALPGVEPRWSPDGEWLTYLSPGTPGLQLYNLADGRRVTLPTQTGSAATWCPAGGALLMTDIRPVGQRYLMHLLRYDAATGELLDLTAAWAGEALIEDGSAAWSPDGAWIAVVRRTIDDTQRRPGNQVWLIRPDGREAHPLTTEPDVIYLTPVWSPDGASLLVTRYLMTEDLPLPAIWLLDAASGDGRPVVAPGEAPAWLPAF